MDCTSLNNKIRFCIEPIWYSLRILNSYTNDDICGTWEKLADAVYPGGYQKLSKLPYQVRGREKTTWAEKISPLMDFLDQLRRLSRQ